MYKLIALLSALLFTGCVGTTNFVQPAVDATIKTIFVADLKSAEANYATALTLPGLTPAQTAELQAGKDCLDGVLAVVSPDQKTVTFNVAGLVSAGSVADINVIVAAPNGGVQVPQACKVKVADIVLRGAGAVAPVKLIQ